MQTTKSYGILLFLFILVEILSVAASFSSLNGYLVISNNGRIRTTTTNTPYSSEIRGVVGHENIYGSAHDWNIIAQTLRQYDVNAFFVNDQGGLGRRPDSEINAAITAFHANGIEYHSVSNVLGETKGFGNAYCAIKSDGTVYDTFVQCPILAHDVIVANLQSYLTAFPDVDGFMFDYTRYAVQDTCYCDSCKAAFTTWLGEGPITDWTPFYGDGTRGLEYEEWRTIPVTTLVADMRAAALAIKPNLQISEAAWTYFSDNAAYWRKYIGQDTGKWIKEGYLDFVAPMMYTKTIYGTSGETLESEINADQKYMVGGVEGKIPLVALLDCARGITPTDLKAEVDYVRSRGLDGWILWQYGGPGSGNSYPDIRNFLSVLSLPVTFEISNIQVATGRDYVAISWATSLPATSKVEYSISPLFNATTRVFHDFSAWVIDHTEGTVVENNTAVINHNITLTGLLPGTAYYFRVQSQDQSGIATCKELEFTSVS